MLIKISAAKYKISTGWIFFVFISFLFINQSSGQGEANHWYFGNYSGITFNTTPPTGVTNGKLNTQEGCASISDRKGNLLFYTDGISVWDSSHKVTPHGTGLKGNSSSTQSAIIVPKPGNSKQYYIFTVDDVGGSDGLQYSLYDLNLNKGLGDIDSSQKNIMLITPTCEKVTAVQHANNKDFWVITHKSLSDTVVAYLITASGVSKTPVKSLTGLYINSGGGSTLGYLKASPDGKKIAYANWTFDTCAFGEFNSNTGVVKNVWSFALDDAYGIEFSSNSKFLYMAEMYKSRIYQFDANANNIGDFKKSKTLVDSIKSTIGALQLGPDKKIYIGRYGTSHLDVIHAPDSLGSLCRVRYNYIDLLSKVCNYGLPTFIQSYFKTSFSFNGNCFGDTAWFSVKDSSEIDSVQWSFDDTSSKKNNFKKGFRVFHLFSDTGFYKVRSIAFKGMVSDTNYLLVNQQIYLGRLTELDKEVYKCFDDTIKLSVYRGEEWRIKWSNKSDSMFTYTVDTGYLSIKKYFGSKCYADDSIRVINYKSNQIAGPFSIGKDLTKCYHDSVKLSFKDTLSTRYEWSNGKKDTSISVFKPSKIMLKAYYGGSCYKEDTIEIFNSPAIKFSLGKDTFICKNQSVMLGYFDEGFFGYLWNNASIDPFLVTDTAGIYSLKIKDSLGCYKSDTIKVSLLNPPKVNLGKDTMVCDQVSSYILDAKNPSAFNKFKWGSGRLTQTDTVTQTGKYWVRITNACGTSIDTIYIKYLNKPKVMLPTDSIFCDTINITLDAQNKDSKYNWSNQLTTQTIQIKDTGIYKIVVSNYCGKDSSSMRISKFFTPYFKPFNDTITCNQSNLKLFFGKPNNGENYSWYDLTYKELLQGFDTLLCSSSGTIEAKISNKCGQIKDTFVYKHLLVPKIKLDTLYEFCKSLNLVLDINDTKNEQTYFWSNSQNTGKITILQQGKYWVKAKNFCGIDSVNFRVALYQFPDINLGNDTQFCNDFSTILETKFNGEKTNYLWNTGETTKTIIANKSGKYWVSISNYCGNSKDSIYLNRYQKTIPNIGPNQIFCDVMAMTKKTIKLTNANEMIQWSTGSTDTTETFTKPNKYWITIASPCGIIKDSVEFKLSESPKVDLGRDTALCGNFAYLLDAGNPGSNYLWMPTGELTQTVFANKQIQYQVTVTNNDGCKGKSSLNINGNCISKIWFPNAFSPNNDQLNETFKPILVNFEKYNMQIFNRWGELLFETNQIENGWDGIYKSIPCQSGVYFFVANFVSTENNKHQIIKGSVTLIK